MRKEDAKAMIQNLCLEWRHECALDVPEQKLQFSDFRDWVLDRHPQALAFRSTMPPVDVAEMWFDEVFKQTWRN